MLYIALQSDTMLLVLFCYMIILGLPTRALSVDEKYLITWSCIVRNSAIEHAVLVIIIMTFYFFFK